MHSSNEFTNNQGFNNTSLQGTYAIANTGRGGHSPQAGVGSFTFDGKGNFSGFNILNLPGPSFGERSLVRSTFEGTYTVEKNSFGTGIVKINLPDGSTSETSFIFAIAKAEEDKIAQEVFFILKDLEPITGNLNTIIATRLPDQGEFSLASFKGTFAFNGLTQGGQTSSAGIGLITFDGKGKYSGEDVLNVPATSFGERTIMRSPFEGTYTMHEGGIYPAISSPSQSEAIFLITKAETVDGVKVAQEYFYIVPSNNLAVTGGNFVVSIGKRLPD